MNKTTYTSVTETVARFLSLLISLLCFSIYVLSKETQFLVRIDWAMLMVHLLIFWATYEVFSFCFFVILQQFSATRDMKIEQIIPSTQSNLESKNPPPVEPNDNFDK
jgi:hypothetical protein